MQKYLVASFAFGNKLTKIMFSPTHKGKDLNTSNLTMGKFTVAEKSVSMLIIYQRSGEDATRIVGYIWGYKDLLTHMRSPGGRVPRLMGLPEINPN